MLQFYTPGMDLAEEGFIFPTFQALYLDLYWTKHYSRPSSCVSMYFFSLSPLTSHGLPTSKTCKSEPKYYY